MSTFPSGRIWIDGRIEIDTKELDSIISKMSKNLEKLEEIKNNINDAYLSLDETKWSGIDKKKIEIAFQQNQQNCKKYIFY